MTDERQTRIFDNLYKAFKTIVGDRVLMIRYPDFSDIIHNIATDTEAEIDDLKAMNQKLITALSDIWGFACEGQNSGEPIGTAYNRGQLLSQIQVIAAEAIKKGVESRDARLNTSTNRPQIVPKSSPACGNDDIS